MASRRRKLVDAELSRFVERAMRTLTLRVWQVLTVETPVLSGFARAGWVPSSGSPESGPASSDASGAAAKAQADALFRKNSQLAAALAKGYTLAQGSTFVVNAVRYVVFLNEGTSAQAPAMFVEAGVTTALVRTRRELGRGP